MTTDTFTIVRLIAADTAAFRHLRLEGLRQHPEAFGASWEDEAALPETEFEARLRRNVVFATRSDENGQLDGLVGLHQPEASKVKHKAILWGMYVSAPVRRTGRGTALINAVIASAPATVEAINLAVGVSNTSAYRLYLAAGFRQYGLETRALKVGDVCYDEALMSLVLPRPG